MDSHLTAIQYTGPGVLPYWPDFEPFVVDGLKHSMGEKTPEDILQAVVLEKMQIFAVYSQGILQSLCVTSLTQYPQYKIVFLEVAAGKHFVRACQQFWPAFRVWAEANEAVAVEACCRPAMTRLLQRLKFRKVYDTVRVSLGESNVRH